MPSLACDALEAGLDGPSIRRLAALINPSGWETDQILPKFMAEAGLQNVSPSEACVRLARHLAVRILSEGLDPLNFTCDFESLWSNADYPRELEEAGCLQDQADYGGQTESEFREYARSVLSALAFDTDEGSDG